MGFVNERTIFCLTLLLSIIAGASGLTIIARSHPSSPNQDQDHTLNETSKFQNPIHDDPWLYPTAYLHTDGFYYLAMTSSNLGNFLEVHLYKSKSLTNWRDAESQLVFVPPEGFGQITSPKVIVIDGHFYIYLAMVQIGDVKQMYVIKADDSVNPLLSNWSAPSKLTNRDQDFHVTAGTILPYGDGRLYLIFASYNPNTARMNLYIARMCNAMSRCGNNAILAEPKLPWEVPHLLYPNVLQHNGRTFVSYTCDSDTDYKRTVGITWIDDLKDPMINANWWRMDNPVFWADGTDGVGEVGAVSFTTSPDASETWMVYYGIERSTFKSTPRVQLLTWNLENNSPIFPTPVGLGIEIDKPSGEE